MFVKLLETMEEVMKKEFRAVTKIGPGILEEIIIEGLKKRGMLPEDNTINPVTRLYHKNMFGKQTEIFVNQVKVAYKGYEKD